ncbi:MAG: phosphoglucosamine mutase [Candidatus Bipolaricaulaceae bacterium]
MPKYFGTDGVRGRAGVELTVELALAVAQAAARAFRPEKVLMARDTRASGPALSAACAAGFLSQGVQILDAGILPSPAVSHLLPREKIPLGLVVSASHNPPEDNGLKFYNSQGYKLSVAEEERVEAALEGPGSPVTERFGEIRAWPEALDRYLALLRSFVPEPRLAGVKLVVDCAHGATIVAAPCLFGELGPSLSFLGLEPDGWRINATGAAAPKALQEAVRAEGADLGIGLDGDGDRAVFVDETGRIVEGDQLMAALAPHLWEWGEIREKAVVFTVLANMGAEKYLRERGFAVIRVPVGDRHVAWAMREKDVDLGGEPSGHIVFRRYTVTGDGLLTGLLVLSYLRRLGKSLGELVAPVPLYPQVRRDVPVSNREQVMADLKVREAIARAQARLAHGRLVVRPSGTQPVIRILAEGPEENRLSAVVEFLAEVVRAADQRISGDT